MAAVRSRHRPCWQAACVTLTCTWLIISSMALLQDRRTSADRYAKDMERMAGQHEHSSALAEAECDRCHQPINEAQVKAVVQRHAADIAAQEKLVKKSEAALRKAEVRLVHILVVTWRAAHAVSARQISWRFVMLLQRSVCNQHGRPDSLKGLALAQMSTASGSAELSAPIPDWAAA